MINYQDKDIRSLLMQGGFGIEKESLRIHRDGSFSHSPHPFPDDRHIVRDFCENQLEINTGVSKSPARAVRELAAHEEKAEKKLAGLCPEEILWPFSNPPYIKDASDIPVARFEGSCHEKTLYRNC